MMTLITADISNIWGILSLPDLLALEKEIFDAHKQLQTHTGRGGDRLGWMTLPDSITREARADLREAAARIAADAEYLVVLGDVGAQAAVRLMATQAKPRLLFFDGGFSSRAQRNLEARLQDRPFAVVVIAGSDMTTEQAVSLRALKLLLERRYGEDGAKKRIYVVTDPSRGTLRKLAASEGYAAFSLPADAPGNFGAVSAGGLLPMAVAGIDPEAVLSGASDARAQLDIRSFENPAWLYAAARTLLARKGFRAEFLGIWEPDTAALGRWWQALFAAAEGKSGHGMATAPLQYPRDLHTVGQLLQDGPRTIVETTLRFAPPSQRATIEMDWQDAGGVDALGGKTLDAVGEQAAIAAIEAHADGGVPIITLECGAPVAQTLGELFYFFQLSCALSGYLAGLNPFATPGADLYELQLGKRCGMLPR
ncbi:MAG: hypothetical protein PHS97_02025 [Oscillospiraceae bacterium]|nr:hypothetical protein [Oscillospiraceae bacterium]